jgi:hypothetical protein
VFLALVEPNEPGAEETSFHNPERAAGMSRDNYSTEGLTGGHVIGLRTRSAVHPDDGP